SNDISDFPVARLENAVTGPIHIKGWNPCFRIGSVAAHTKPESVPISMPFANYLISLRGRHDLRSRVTMARTRTHKPDLDPLNLESLSLRRKRILHQTATHLGIGSSAFVLTLRHPNSISSLTQRTVALFGSLLKELVRELPFGI